MAARQKFPFTNIHSGCIVAMYWKLLTLLMDVLFVYISFYHFLLCIRSRMSVMIANIRWIQLGTVNNGHVGCELMTSNSQTLFRWEWTPNIDWLPFNELITVEHSHLYEKSRWIVFGYMDDNSDNYLRFKLWLSRSLTVPRRVSSEHIHNETQCKRSDGVT